LILEEFNGCVHEVQLYEPPRMSPWCTKYAYEWYYRKHKDGTVHEPATLAAFIWVRRHHLKFKNPIVYDLGAHIGYFSMFCQLLWQEVRIVAFDMHPGAFSDLRNNLIQHQKHKENVTFVHAAMSDIGDGDKKDIFISGFNIYEKPDSGWEALKEQPGANKKRGDGGAGKAKIPFCTIDGSVEHFGIPDLIKIDVEGYQAKAIAGAHNTIKKHRPIVIIELHDKEKTSRLGTTNAQTVQPLFDAGYEAYWCGNHRDMDATFEPVHDMKPKHETLSLMLFLP
jgi:FkbM family methyltransferase